VGSTCELCVCVKPYTCYIHVHIFMYILLYASYMYCFIYMFYIAGVCVVVLPVMEGG
jgi:hypothetical protein